MPKKTYVYIDGFNLYYGSLNRKNRKGVGYKWLNLESWLEKLLPPSIHDIQKIKFYTARVSATSHDPQKPVRQDTYLRALRTLPKVEIVQGYFAFPSRKIQITKDVCVVARVPEEKGTDVNLAVHMVEDGYKGLYDTAVIVSNDSDMGEALRIVSKELNLEIGLINPSGTHFSKSLNKYSSFKEPVREKPILASQFPASLTDSVGTFTKPKSW